MWMNKKQIPKVIKALKTVIQKLENAKPIKIVEAESLEEQFIWKAIENMSTIQMVDDFITQMVIGVLKTKLEKEKINKAVKKVEPNTTTK